MNYPKPDQLLNTHLHRGCESRDFKNEPYGSLAYAAPFNLPLKPRDVWADIIKEDEQNQTRVQDLVEHYKIPPQHQGSTNYCWINCVIRSMELLRLSQGQEYVELSPASAGGPMTNYSNQGGWPHRGVEWVSDHGVVPVSLWPANAINRRYDTPESKAARADYKINEWVDFEPRNFAQLMTWLLVRKTPVATAHNWMRHAVTAVAPLHLGRNQFGILFHNSGYGRDANGYTVLSESKATPDSAIAPTLVTAS